MVSEGLMTQTDLGSSQRFLWRLKEDHLNDSDQYLNFFEKRLSNLRGFPESSGFSDQELLGCLPPWQTLKDVNIAIERILTAIRRSERIVIFGDYDVDGTTSCAMLQLAFEDLGVATEYYIPDRLIEGYGLNSIGLEKIAAAGSALVITVDNGISAVDACVTARQLGLDIIITDHHEPPPELPSALAILNPKQPGCEFPFKMLAGVGVAFYLLIGLRAALREQNYPRVGRLNLKKYLDLVAIGTIADVAPLNGVNHVLARVGLGVMLEHVVNGTRPGISALLRLAGWKFENGVIDATDVGFKVGPRLNAAGRLGSARASAELMVTQDQARATELAAFLHSENAQRQELEKKTVENALRMVAIQDDQSASLVLYNPDWHAGVIGLVASRVAEKLNKPTLILTRVDSKLKGSGRSVPGFDLFGALNAMRENFISFGGHEYAVGMSLDEGNLEWLRGAFEEQVCKTLGISGMKPSLELDGVVTVDVLQDRLCALLDSMEPFGAENPRPKWLIQRVMLGHSKRIGKAADSNHARVWLSPSVDAGPMTAFGLASEIETHISAAEPVDLVVEGRLSRWGGKLKSELRILDIRSAHLN
jgi:single-stranded-DNA-specific exonuclease